MEKWSGTGELKQPIIDYQTGHLEILFEPRENFREAYDELKDCGTLDIQIRKHREKASMNANSYFHALLGQIAKKLDISRPYCKNMLIYYYGEQMFLPNGNEAVIKTNVPPEIMLENDEPHCWPAHRCDPDESVTWYKLYRGTHTYNTLEMSKLIDGTVYEAKKLGIETLTPKQLEEMKQAWPKEQKAS